MNNKTITEIEEGTETMGELPFLVVHGWWIAKLLVVAPAIVGIIAFALVRRRLDLRTARRLAGERIDAAKSPGEGSQPIRGVYRAADGGALDVDGGTRIVFDAPPVVVRGTRARWTFLMAEPKHELVDGDTVIATGTLTHASAESGEPIRWTLSNTELVALDPASCPKPRVLLSLTLFALGCVASYVSLRAVGERIVERREIDFTGRATKTDLDGESLVIAAALPGTREAALRRLSEVADRELVSSHHTTELQLALAELGDRSCYAKQQILQREYRIDEALAEAQRCGDGPGQFDTLLELGRYEEAATFSQSAWSNAEQAVVYIMAGRWTDAATAIEGASHGGDVSGCIAELFRMKAGDPGAHDRLTVRAAKAQDECKLVAAIADEDTARVSELADKVDHQSRLRNAALLAAWARGLVVRFQSGSPSLAVLWRGSFWTDEKPWIARFAVRANETFEAHSWAAVLDTYRGDFDDARREIAAGVALLPADDKEHIDAMRTLDASVQVRAGISPIVPTPPGPIGSPLDDVVELIEHRPGQFTSMMLGTRFCEHQLEEPIKAAADGDGEPLARVFLECGVLSVHGELLALLPRISRGREALNAAIGPALLADFAGVHESPMPFSFVAGLALARDLMRMSGRTAEERKLQSMIDAHAKVFADRDKMIGVLLAEAL